MSGEPVGEESIFTYDWGPILNGIQDYAVAVLIFPLLYAMAGTRLLSR